MQLGDLAAAIEAEVKKGFLGFDKVRERAYSLWEQAGRPAGSGEEFWQAAEEQLRSEAAQAIASQITRQILSPSIQEANARLQDAAAGYTKKASVCLADLVKQAMLRDSSVMPDGVRFYRKFRYDNTDHEIVVVEGPPTVRTLLVDMGWHPQFIGSVSRSAGRRPEISDHQRKPVPLFLP